MFTTLWRALAKPWFWLAVVFSVSTWGSTNANDPLLGERIYVKGALQNTSATIGSDQHNAPTQLFPCINCHGDDGRGKFEAGINAPSIRWQDLNYRHHINLKNAGMQAEHYTKLHLNQALQSGLNAQGNTLSHLMPRYILTSDELDALVHYLKTLERQTTPGLAEHAIRIAVILPKQYQQDQLSRLVLASEFNFRNSFGDRYQRKYQLHFFSREHNFKQLDQGARDQHNYFIVLNINPLGEPNPAAHMHAFHLSLFADSLTEKNSQSFALYASRAAYPKITKLFAARANNRIDNKPSHCANSPASVYLPSLAQLEHQIMDSHRASCPPIIFTALPHLNSPPKLAVEYAAPLYGVLPPTPALTKPKGQRHYVELIRHLQSKPIEGNNKLPSAELPLQLWLLTLCDLIDNLVIAGGRELNQNTLQQQLSQHYKYNNPFGPDLSFVANRHTGAYGALLAPLNAKAREGLPQKGEWFEANDDESFQ